MNEMETTRYVVYLCISLEVANRHRVSLDILRIEIQYIHG
jgi:hypothetical protein